MNSLRRRLVFSTVLLFTVVMATMLFAARSLVQSSLNDELQLSADRDRALLVAAVVPLMASRDLAEASDLLERLVTDKAFVYVEIDDASNRSWARAGRRPDTGVHHFDGEMALEGRVFGRYRFGVDSETSQRAEGRVVTGLLGIAVVGLASAALLQMLLAQVLTRRLEALTQGVDRLAAGERGLQLPVAGEDEAASLAQAFNRMSAALSERLSALQDSEQRQRLLVDSLSAGVLFQDENGVVLECNDAACRILGLPREQLLGLSAATSPLRMLSRSGEEVVPAQRPAAQAVRSGQPVRDAILHVGRSDGSWIWMSLNSQPLVRVGETQPYATVDRKSVV